MKLSKLLLTSTLIVAPVAAITPAIVSCNKQVPFEAYTSETHITTSNREIAIPLTFSYSPANSVIVNLVGDDIEELTYPSTIEIVNNKAILKIKISNTLNQSKLFKFDISFSYGALSLPFVLKGFYIIFQFEPEEKDSVLLKSPSIVETTNSKCTFKIQFSAEPTSVGGWIGTQLAMKSYTTLDIPVQCEAYQQIKKEDSQFYLYFEINIPEDKEELLDVYFFATFDLILSFDNSKQHPQVEVIPYCVYTHLTK